MMKWLWYLGALVFVLSIVLLLDYILLKEYKKRKEESDSEAQGL